MSKSGEGDTQRMFRCSGRVGRATGDSGHEAHDGEMEQLQLPPGSPGASAVKNPPSSAEDMSSILGSGRSLGEGHGKPL